MTKYIFAFSFTFICLLSCKKEVKPVFPSGDIGYNECVSFPNKQLEICLKGIKEYRCPCDAYCIWEGSVDTDLLIKRAGRPDITIGLSSNPILKKDTMTLDGTMIRLKAVNQPSDCPFPTTVDGYSVTLVVE
jgi:hypothetical protein